MSTIKKIKVCGRTYDLKYPNVGNFIDIKVLETKLSQGSAMSLVNGTGEQLDAYFYITTYAHFQVLCPDLLKDLKVNSLLELSLLDFQELLNVYLQEIQPWIAEIQQAVKEKMTVDE